MKMVKKKFVKNANFSTIIIRFQDVAERLKWGKVTLSTYTQPIDNSLLNPCIEEVHIFFAVVKNILHLSWKRTREDI